MDTLPTEDTAITAGGTNSATNSDGVTFETISAAQSQSSFAEVTTMSTTVEWGGQSSTDQYETVTVDSTSGSNSTTPHTPSDGNATGSTAVAESASSSIAKQVTDSTAVTDSTVSSVTSQVTASDASVTDSTIVTDATGSSSRPTPEPTNSPSTSTTSSTIVSSPQTSSDSAAPSIGSTVPSSTVRPTSPRITSVVTSVTDETSVTTDVTTPGGGGLSQPAIIGIAVGVSLAAVIVVVVLVVIFVRRKRRASRRRYQSEDNLNDYKLDLPSSNPSKNRSKKHANGDTPVTSPHTGAPFFQNKDPDPSTEGATNDMFEIDLNERGEETDVDDVGESDVTRRTNNNKANRPFVAESRYSMGPILLGEGDDIGVSTDNTYNKVYSTNTFKSGT